MGHRKYPSIVLRPSLISTLASSCSIFVLSLGRILCVLGVHGHLIRLISLLMHWALRLSLLLESVARVNFLIVLPDSYSGCLKSYVLLDHTQKKVPHFFLHWLNITPHPAIFTASPTLYFLLLLWHTLPPWNLPADHLWVRFECYYWFYWCQLHTQMPYWELQHRSSVRVTSRPFYCTLYIVIRLVTIKTDERIVSKCSPKREYLNCNEGSDKSLTRLLPKAEGLKDPPRNVQSRRWRRRRRNGKQSKTGENPSKSFLCKTEMAIEVSWLQALFLLDIAVTFLKQAKEILLSIGPSFNDDSLPWPLLDTLKPLHRNLRHASGVWMTMDKSHETELKAFLVTRNIHWDLSFLHG